MILWPVPIFVSLHPNPIGVLVGTGVLMVQVMFPPVHFSGKTDGIRTEHVADKIIPGFVFGEAVVGCFVHQGEQAVLPGGHGHDTDHVNQGIPPSDVGRHGLIAGNDADNPEPLAANRPNAPPFGNLR